MVPLSFPVRVPIMNKEIINIIEIDGRDARFQTGIGRYMDVLGEHMPEHIKTLRIIFYWSPDFAEIHITQSEHEISVKHPAGYPVQILFDAVIAFAGARIAQMHNLIIKSNCLGYEHLAYMLRTRIYAKTIGVLHCLPHRSRSFNGQFPPVNPFFNMDHIILVCDAGTEYLMGVKNNRPYSVIYNGIDIPKIKSQKPNDGVFRFIFANGWAPHKGLERIIPAIRTVAKQHNIEIMVIGGYDDKHPIFGQISDLPITRVGLLTRHDDISKYYEIADCALFASYSEACSFAGIEAMAYNLPIISSDAAGLIEMFGRAAIIVNSNSHQELDTNDYAAQMLRVINSKALRTKMGILSYGRYKERYTVQKMVRNTVKLYESLLSRTLIKA